MATNCAAETGEGAGAAFLWTDKVIAGLAEVKNPEAPAVKREAEEDWSR